MQTGSIWTQRYLFRGQSRLLHLQYVFSDKNPRLSFKEGLTFSQSSRTPFQENCTFFSPFQRSLPVCHHCVPVCACARAWSRIPPQSTLRFPPPSLLADVPTAPVSEFESILINSSSISVVVSGSDVVDALLGSMEALPTVDMVVDLRDGVCAGGR